MKSSLAIIFRLLLICLFLSPAFVSAQMRSKEEIRQIALSFFGQQSGEVETRAVRSIEYIPSSAFVEGAAGQEVFYLCNMPAEGFVLVSTNENLPEIFGYSSVAYHADRELPAGLLDLMQSYVSLSEGFSALAPLSAQVSVAPMLTTKWDQGDPYNRMCPRDGTTRSMVGCVATAAAQVMKYYRWPEKKGTGKINYVTDSRKISVSVDLSENTLAWDLMLDEYAPEQFSNAQANAVAKLMYTVGAACRMDYSYAESGTSLVDAVNGLSQYFGYDKDMYLLYGDIIPADIWNEIIVREINQSRPVIFSGAAANGSGHAFLLDGYETRSGSIYYHVNWGWSGSGDGYYLVNNLTPSGNGIGSGFGSFNNSQLILLNCQPEDGKMNPVYAQVGKMTMSKTSYDSGEKIMFNVSLKNIFCMLASDFSGSLQLVFVDESGVTCCEETLSDVVIQVGESLGAEFSNVQTKALPDGSYSVKMYLKSREGRKIECIPNNPWPKIWVGNAENAITSIQQEDESLSFHTLMGTKMKAASNQSLPAGFYVIDNRMVIIR